MQLIAPKDAPPPPGTKPFGQLLQEVAPKTLECVWLGQFEQAPEPGLALYVPCLHAPQPTLPAKAKLPAGHVLHCDWLLALLVP